jgi:glutamyl-Q tRNA(Asp) synthetase
MPVSPDPPIDLTKGRDDRGLFSAAASLQYRDQYRDQCRGHYRGRFAPSPTGPLHAGSLVAALASWLDARAHNGVWLLRIEDTDTPRCIPGAAQTILAQLVACGLAPDEAPTYQSDHFNRYDEALTKLVRTNLAYACGCSRKDIDDVWQARGVAHGPGSERPYPGTCRHGLQGKAPRAWRLRTDPRAHAKATMHWHDRRLGPQTQDVQQAVGDFVLKRADGLWAYQLAVVVDDAAQGITHVVRGEDLADNTARQILLQRALKLPMPAYLHTPLVLAADGQKLSKQTGALALDLGHPLAALQAAAQVLGLPDLQAPTQGDWLAQAVLAWQEVIATQSAGIIAAFTTTGAPGAEDDSA